MPIAIQVMPYTGRPTLSLALESKIRILQFQRPVNLLQRHRCPRIRKRIENENSVVVRRLGQILWRISRLGRIVRRRRTRGLALLGRRHFVLLGALIHRHGEAFWGKRRFDRRAIWLFPLGVLPLLGLRLGRLDHSILGRLFTFRLDWRGSDTAVGFALGGEFLFAG